MLLIFVAITIVIAVACLFAAFTENEKTKRGGPFLVALIIGGAVCLSYSIWVKEVTQGYPQELNEFHMDSNVIVEVIHETDIAGKHLVVIRGPKMKENSWRIFMSETAESFGLGLKTTKCNQQNCELSPVETTRN